MEELRVMPPNSHQYLNHGAVTMARDAVIMGRHIRTEGVCGESLRNAVDIGSRESGLEMLVTGMVDSGSIELGHSIKSGFDTVS